MSAPALSSGCRAAVFGKHPAAADHMEGIGLSTPGLSAFKQMFYIDAIEQNVGRGRWKLDEDGGLPFGHLIITAGGGAVITADVSASQDAKGRKQYPLITAVESAPEKTAIASAGLLSRVLDSFRDAFHAAEDAPGLRAVRERLDARLAEDAELPVIRESAREKLLTGGGADPGSTSVLRVLHAMSSSGTAIPRARVSLAGSTDDAGLAVWLELVRAFFPDRPAVTLMHRRGEAWADIALAPPNAEAVKQLFSARASVPLTSEIPFQLDPGFTGPARDRLAEWRSTGLCSAGDAPLGKKICRTFGGLLKMWKPKT